MTGALDFDQALPLLPLIDDRECATRLLDADADAVVSARRQDTKYRPGVECIAGYELQLLGPGPPILGAVAVTPRGITGYRATGDPALPGLAEALDPTMLAARFSRVLPARSGPQMCTATAVRYKPGVRCVIRYEVRAGDDTAVFFGKLVSADSEAQLTLIDALSRGAADVPDAPRPPPITDHWPDLGLVLQAAVTPAIEMHRLVTDPSVPVGQRLDALRRAGRTLAGLHSVALPEAPGRSFADALTELVALQPPIACADPVLSARYAAVLATLKSENDGEHGLAVTCHGAFRTDQLLLCGRQLVLIDLDTLCHSEAALDLGNLLAYLDWKAIRRPSAAPFLAAAGTAVIDGYRERRPLPARRRLDLHRAASLLKIAGRRFRSLTVSEWPLVTQLVTASAKLVEDKGGPS